MSNAANGKPLSPIGINQYYYEQMDYPENKTLAGLFIEQARLNPERTALIHGGISLSYRELNEKTNAIAEVLIKEGVCPDAVAGILCDQSPELVIGMISILKAGGAFLAIDPAFPKDRINFMLENSKINILLTKSAFLVKSEFNGRILDLDHLSVIQSVDDQTGAGKPDGLAYILYTSGSTGVPKAVMVEHRNSANALYYLKNKLDAGSPARVIQFFSPSFSVSYQEIFIALLFGGTLFIIDESIRGSIVKLLDFVRQKEVNTLFLPSSYLKLINNNEKFYKKLPGTIRHIVTAGEQFLVQNGFLKYLDNNQIVLHNNYGTSEANISAMLDINGQYDHSGFLPIGKPIANTHIYILDENLEAQSVGNEGELYISGHCVGRGYFNNPELTSEKFVADPFVNGMLMYRTGDLGKWLPDGNIQLLGRKDYQVKIRGYRIELEEIELNLLKHPMVKEAVVVAGQGSDGGKFLYAYILTDKPVMSKDIKEFLAARIPDYMMPAYIIRLNGLPKTPSGKIDRKALIENRTVLLDEHEGLSESKDCPPESVIVFDELKIILESITGNKLVNINYEDDFSRLGLDSISIIKLAADIENKFGFTLDDDELNEGCRTVKDLIACINERSSLANGGKYEAEP